MKRSRFGSKALAIFLTIALITSFNVPIAWGEMGADATDAPTSAPGVEEATPGVPETTPENTGTETDDADAPSADDPAKDATTEGAETDPSAPGTADGSTTPAPSNARTLSSKSNEEFVAEVVDADGNVVKQYPYISKAFSDGKNKTVRLLQDIPAANARFEINESMTIDLNGHSVGSLKNWTFYVNKFGSEIHVTFKNGTITNTCSKPEKGVSINAAIYALQGGNVTLENVTLDARPSVANMQGYGLRIGNTRTKVDKPYKQQPDAVVNEGTAIYGTFAGIAVISDSTDASTLTVNGGTIKGETYGIVGNGTSDTTSITVNGGTVQSLSADDGVGIYHPQDGNLTISGGSIQGPAAVQVCGAGNVSITDGELHATAPEGTPVIQSGDGPVADGAALSIVSRGGEYGAAESAKVSITGGSLISDHNVALLEYGASEVKSLVSSMDVGGENLFISGGAGKADLQFNKLSGDAAKVVSGGFFASKVPVEYCAPTYVPTDQLDNGKYSVRKPAIQVRSDFNGSISSIHDSLSEAFAAAAASSQEKPIVAIVGDYTMDANVSIPENTYLDVRDGATLTVPSGVTLTVPDNCLRLGIWKGGTLNIEDGGKVLIEKGSTSATNMHGFVMLQEGSTLKGELSVPDGCFLDKSGTSYAASELSNAVVKLVKPDGSVTYATQKNFANLDYADGDTLVLLKNVTSPLFFSVPITLDLNGFTLTCSDEWNGSVINASDNLVIKNGTVKAGAVCENVVQIAGGSLTIESDATIDGGPALGIFVDYESGLVVNGTVKSTDGCAISGNGNGGSDNTTITINKGAMVTSENSTAIYHPQIGTIDVLGGTVRGITGIEMRSGDLNVSGGIIEATADSFTSLPNGNGSTSTGVGVAVAQHTTGHPINVNITGGDISGIYALHESNPQNNDVAVIAQVKLNISGGTFKAVKGGTDAVSSEDVSTFITGGTFDTVVPTTYYDTDRYAQNVQNAATDPGKIVPREFSLTYDLEQGTLPSGKSNPATYTYLDEVTLVNPERAGYTFAGWTGGGLSQATVNVTIPKDSTGDRAYVATWTANPASIVFETNGGAKIDALEGATDGPITGTLPTPVRDGFKFAGWFGNAALTGNAVASLPATFPAGATTLYAKWTKEIVEGNATIVVELPGVVGDDVSATVAEDAATAALDNAKSALSTLKAGGILEGMSAEDAAKLKAALADSSKNVVVRVTLGIERINETVDGNEKAAIDGVKEGHELVAAYFDLSVSMTVEVIDPVTGQPVHSAITVPLSSVEKPLLFELRTDPSTIAGKSVRIAHVHNGATEIIYPESVDRAAGTVRFFGYKFSTYALLTSSQVTVRFDPAGGTLAHASDATQTVGFGKQVAEPAAPTRAGYQFTGWFIDEGAQQKFDFSQGIENPLTLYAGWTVQKEGEVKTPPVTSADPGSKKTPPSNLTSTGDQNAVAVEAILALALAAALIACAALTHRRRKSGR